VGATTAPCLCSARCPARLWGLVQGPAALSSARGAGGGAQRGSGLTFCAGRIGKRSCFSEVQSALSAALPFTCVNAGGALRPLAPGRS